VGRCQNSGAVSGERNRRTQIVRESFTPEQRSLSEGRKLRCGGRVPTPTSVEVAAYDVDPGWGDLRSDAAMREFVRSRPFVSLRPVDPRGSEQPRSASTSMRGNAALARDGCLQCAAGRPSKSGRFSYRLKAAADPLTSKRSCGSAVEAANRSRPQQLCAPHRSPSGLSERRQRTAASAGPF
jgi:hypothetical protein